MALDAVKRDANLSIRAAAVTTASGQDRYTNSQKASYIAHSAIVHYPAIYVRYSSEDL
jgi:hypothetical protein